MTLYHGSFLEIAKPDLVHSRPNVDFGRGFYVTPLYEQAAKWCGKFKRRGKDGIISRYEYDESRETELKTLKFDSYSEEWLVFILDCRSGKDSTDYDLVVGGVANDKVFNTVELFFDRLIDIQFYFKKSTVVLLSALPNDRDFHWMRRWIFFTIPRSISSSVTVFLICTA